MGTDPAYWRAWRAAHPEYRRREVERSRRRKLELGRGDRRAEYARRRSRAAADATPLAPLYPDLVRGAVVSFVRDELRMDLAQERALAELEGRDPDQAVAKYRGREHAWIRMTIPLADWT